MFYKVVTRAEGRVHTLVLRDVKLTDAGEVSLTAKDFRTQANLFVKGKSVILITLWSVLIAHSRITLVKHINIHHMSN